MSVQPVSPFCFCDAHDHLSWRCCVLFDSSLLSATSFLVHLRLFCLLRHKCCSFIRMQIFVPEPQSRLSLNSLLFCLCCCNRLLLDWLSSLWFVTLATQKPLGSSSDSYFISFRQRSLPQIPQKCNITVEEPIHRLFNHKGPSKWYSPDKWLTFHGGLFVKSVSQIQGYVASPMQTAHFLQVYSRTKCSGSKLFACNVKISKSLSKLFCKVTVSEEVPAKGWLVGEGYHGHSTVWLFLSVFFFFFPKSSKNFETA